MNRVPTLLVPTMVVLLVPAMCCTPADARPKRGGFGADLLAEIPSRLPMKQMHPSGTDLEVLERSIALALDADGRLTRSEALHKLMLTDHAVNRHGDPRIVHDAKRQTLQVKRAACTMADNKTEVNTQDNGINETTPFALERAPAYCDLRETVVTHVGLERLGTTHLEHAVVDREKRAFPLHLEIPLGSAGPTRKLTVEVSVPQGTALKHAVLGRPGVKPAERAEGAMQVSSWTFGAVPAFLDEHRHSAGHPPALGQPRLVLADARDWQAAGKALQALIRTALAANGTMRSKVETLTRDLPTSEQRIERLAHFVQDEVGGVHYPPALLSWEPTTADEALARGYGHALDKAVLLSALLAEIGLQARPVLISRDRLFARDVPSLAQFSEVWVRAWTAPKQERWLAVDGHPAGDPRSVLAGRWAFDPKDGLVQQIEAVPAAANLTDLTAELALDGDRSVKGKASLTLTGTANPYAALRAKGKGPDGLAAEVAGMLAHGAEPTSQTLQGFDATRTTLELDLTATAQTWEAERFLRLPVADGPGFLAERVPELAREKRHTPLKLDSAMVQRSRVTWKLPEGLKLRQVPTPVERKNSAGRFAITVKREAQSVTVTRELTLNDGWIVPAQYDAFRELIGAALAPAGRMLVLERDLP